MYHGTTKKAEGTGGGIYPVSEGAWGIRTPLTAVWLLSGSFSGSMEKSAQRIWMHSDGI